MDDLTGRLGLDTGPFARALRGIGRTVDSASASMARAFKGGIGTALGAVGLGALTALGKSAVDFASNLQDVSDNLNVTTDFLQDFTFIMGQAGVSSEQSNKALEKFSRLIGEARQGEEAAIAVFAKYGLSLKNADGSARSTEQSFFDVADRIKNTKDATIQSATAFDFFGKSSAKLVGQLKLGAGAFQELRASIPKLTQEEISQLDNFGDAWTRLGVKVKIAAGQLISAGLNLGEVLSKIRSTQAEQDLFSQEVSEFGFSNALGRRTGRMAQEQNVERWTKEMRARKKAFDEAQGGAGAAVVDPKIAEKQLKFEKDVNDEDKKRISNLKELVSNLREQRQEQWALNDARAAALDSDGRLATAKGDRSKFGFDELVESQVRFTGRLGQEQMAGRLAKRMENRADFLKSRGYVDQANALRNRADAIKEQLTNVVDADRFPFKDMAKSSAESALSLKRLEETIDGKASIATRDTTGNLK